MGAIGGEELKQVEKEQKAQMAGAREERILVVVRLRPLSDKEIIANEVADWECINDNTILYRNTLREGSTFPSAYTFGTDRVFRGDCLTKQVYEEGAKEVAVSVVNGINSTIFAYGQTSSGKTYTMTGITEYTVADIFDYINRHKERAFVLKFSAIEIYNEAIRDLLSSENTQLKPRDDPERGLIVEKVIEEVLRDWNHLKELLSICEAQRKIGETSLNERSSRSHRIIRLTIESSAREFLGKENSTTLAASVNFVDLAGSEQASQSLSTEARLKEGCHINRSLLTLSTVIRKLSKGRQGHINYRDSKLTLILQPCLGGNARTAIICTLSPARSHVEQTRNTLLFACCAKEVATKAQVNVVMSDKALVKHLQREVARLESELKSPVPPPSNSDYAALLRRKDLQIQKARINYHPNQLEGDAWEDDYSASESSCLADSNRLDVHVGKFNSIHCSNTESGSNIEQPYHQPLNNHEDHSMSVSGQSLDETLGETADDPDEYCKEVQCIETEEPAGDYNSDSRGLPNGESEGTLALTLYGDGDGTDQEAMSTSMNGDREANHIQNGIAFDLLEQRLHHIQNTIYSFVSPDKSSPYPQLADLSSSRSLNLNRSLSCRADVMRGTSSHYADQKHFESTPPNGWEKIFPGRPHGYGKKFLLLNYGANNEVLSRNNSQSSLGSASIKSAVDEDITSIQSFVAGLKKQLANGQVQSTGLEVDESRKSMKDVGLDPMHDASSTPVHWPQEFERLQRAILELWQACNVSLVHRTYFFLLFKGDPADSIYMEVELRRLTFLEESFSEGNQAFKDGRTLILASSVRSLRREKQTLSRLLRKRFTEEEREKLYKKWGIELNSKQRRLQLVN
ncbi:kinesin-like protein KIN-7E isoform X2 [Gossypium hirsutum]|uniref:Kinesin-like protein n=1 Tax=Gossypium hirsutum TaxID=3635 RepID=A0ABM3BCS7_GOSHI|nr:kinesin-like protein KIN-7E isoform X2 [Gossypium hirsutum]